MNMGSPVSIFNPDKRVYTPKMKSMEKNENMSLEELISKIDIRREIFKKSVREEAEEYFAIANRFKTPEFTEQDTSAMGHQSTNDQMSYMNGDMSQSRPDYSRKFLTKF